MSTEIKLDSGVHYTNMVPISKKGKSVRIKRAKKNITTDIISDMIEKSDVSTKKVSNDIEDGVLSELNDYVEEPFEIIQSYFI